MIFRQLAVISYQIFLNKHLLNSINSHFVNINWGTQGDYNTVEQWLNYVKHSKFVITDSFHCLAFAIIFRKPFIVVKRDFGGNARIDNILEKLNLQYGGIKNGI